MANTEEASSRTTKGPLISLYGGPDAFVRRLDYLHDHNITYIGNEPAFLTVFQYHYAGRPALSAKRSHFYIPAFFTPTPDGLPGNDDSGAMGSFVAFAMIGLFPNPARTSTSSPPPYLSPSTSRVRRRARRRASATSTSTPASAASTSRNATLDGKPYSKNWLDHSFFHRRQGAGAHAGQEREQLGHPRGRSAAQPGQVFGVQRDLLFQAVGWGPRREGVSCRLGW